jgi:hypothetical protein
MPVLRLPAITPQSLPFCSRLADEASVCCSLSIGGHGYLEFGLTLQCENRLRLSYRIQKKESDQPDPALEIASPSQARAYFQWR